MNHNFHQERCRCTEERLDYESRYDVRDGMFDACWRQAEMELVDATEEEIHDRANELLREMEERE